MNHHRLIATAVVSLASSWALAQPAAAPTGPQSRDSTPAARPATAADAPATTAGTPRSRDARKQRSAAFDEEKARLVQLLQGANEREEYIKVLQNNGYRVASTHVGGPNYLEYEVVKGGQSYEVQLDFDPGARKASKIDVTPNQWRTESTTKMLSDPNYQPAAPIADDTEGRFSDRRYMKGWAEDRQRLEQALPAGLKTEEYKKRIEGLHYKIASVDDRTADEVEYRIVKGDHSYRVQLELDSARNVAQSVEVTDDPWSAEPSRAAKAAATTK